MIEEIPYPFPTIQELQKEDELKDVVFDKENKIVEEKKKKEPYAEYKDIDKEKSTKKPELGLREVAFYSDPSLVSDFAQKAKISNSLAESLMKIFFQELKNQLLKGKFISIRFFGKIWTMAPGIDNKGRFHIPTGKRVYPRYKLGYKIKAKTKKNIL